MKTKNNVSLLQGHKFPRLFIALPPVIYSFFLVAAGLVLGTQMKIKISWDGLLYFVSAKFLFTSEMGKFYHWIREPGYPIFVRAFYKDPYDFSTLILAQAFVISLSVVLVFLYFYFHSTSNALRFLYALSAFFSLMLLIGYSSWILQQSLIIGLAALHVGFFWTNEKSKVLSVKYIASSMMLVFITGLISVILLFGSLIVIFYSIKKVKKNANLNLFKVLLALTIAIIPTLIFQAAWTNFKINSTNGIERVYNDPILLIDRNIERNLADILYYLPTNVLGIIGIGIEKTASETEAQGTPAGSLYFFAFNIDRGGVGCGLFDGGPQPVVDHLNLNWGNYFWCKSSGILTSYHLFTNAVKNLIPLIFFLSFLGVFYLAAMKITELVNPVIFPLVSIIPYLLEPTISGRYGAPFALVAPFCAVAACNVYLRERNHNSKISN